MAAYDIILPTSIGGNNINWENADFTSGSMWGSGNNGQDLWGWTGGAYLTTSDPVYLDGTWTIRVTVKEPDPLPNEELSFISRFNLDDDKKTPGVFSANGSASQNKWWLDS